MRTTTFRIQLFAILLAVYFAQPQDGAASILWVPSEYADIQSAVNASQPSDTILIAPGSYIENIQMTSHGLVVASHFLQNNDSSYISQTVLRGCLPNGDEGRPLVLESVDDVKMVGLSFHDGRVTGENGGAILAISSSLELMHCWFIGNEAEEGGGVYLDSCTATINHCRFRDNIASQAGGGFAGVDGSYTLEYDLFESNISWTSFGGMVANRSSGVIRNCIFDSNTSSSSGGGATTINSGEWVVEGNIFRNNTAARAGGANFSSWDVPFPSSLIIRNNHFIENHAATSCGGGLLISPDFDSLEVVGNVFDSNRSGLYGGGAAFLDELVFNNNVFINNTGESAAAVSVVQGNLTDFLVIGMHNLFLNNRPNWTHYSFMQGAIHVSSNVGLFLEENDIIGNDEYAAYHSYTANHGRLELDNNYWGDPTGPYHHLSAPEGLGDTIYPSVILPDSFSFSATPFTDYRAPNIRVPFQEHNFELVEIGHTSSWDLRIRNGGSEVLSIRGLTCEPDVYSIPDSFNTILGTGEDLYVPVTFAPLTEELTEGSVEIRSNSPYDTLLTIALYGQGTSTGIDGDYSEGLYPVSGLAAPYPNPSNSTVTVRFTLSKPCRVILALYAVTGQQVQQLSRDIFGSGENSISFDTNTLASGIYFVAMEIPEQFSQLRKIAVVK